MTEKLTKDQLVRAIKPAYWEKSAKADRYDAFLQNGGEEIQLTASSFTTLSGKLLYYEAYIQGLYGCRGHDSEFIPLGRFTSIDEAKAAAEKWYQDFILGFMDFKEE